MNIIIYIYSFILNTNDWITLNILIAGQAVEPVALHSLSHRQYPAWRTVNRQG